MSIVSSGFHITDLHTCLRLIITSVNTAPGFHLLLCHVLLLSVSRHVYSSSGLVFLAPRCTLVLLNKSWPLEPRLHLGSAAIAARNFAWRLRVPPKRAAQCSNVQSQIIQLRVKLNVHAVICCRSLVFMLNEGKT